MTWGTRHWLTLVMMIAVITIRVVLSALDLDKSFRRVAFDVSIDACLLSVLAMILRDVGFW